MEQNSDQCHTNDIEYFGNIFIFKKKESCDTVSQSSKQSYQGYNNDTENFLNNFSAELERL